MHPSLTCISSRCSRSPTRIAARGSKRQRAHAIDGRLASGRRVVSARRGTTGRFPRFLVRPPEGGPPFIRKRGRCSEKFQDSSWTSRGSSGEDCADHGVPLKFAHRIAVPADQKNGHFWLFGSPGVGYTPRSMRASRFGVRALFIFAVVASAAGCKEAPKAAVRPPEPVKVAPVTQRDVPIYGEWVGTTLGYVTAQIRAHVSGYLISQNYKEGTVVKQGDLLFQIDPRQFQN